ncbi:MAG: trypsin-like peptidase domain-containing protein [Acutalibacteraceae bacterium]|jgi:serine protease Do
MYPFDPQQPAEPPVNEQPIPQPDEQPAPQPVEPTAEQPSEQPVEQPAPQPVEPTVERPAWTPPTYHYTAGRPYDPYGWQQPATPAPAPKKKKSGVSALMAALACICVAAIVALSVMLALAIDRRDRLPVSNGGGTSTADSADDAPVNENAPTLEIREIEDTDALSTQAIIQKNLDSTVVITTYERNSQFDPFGFNQSTSDDDLVKASTSTGIVMTADGYIITNQHCVINENTGIQYARIDVKTHDGTTYQEATVVGTDADTDLAVIKVEATGLTPAEFGDSAQLTLGDRVIALGSAGGLEWTPTQGIISGLARDVYDDTGYSIKCLQTDATINPGNSGGPLINAVGQVVGINSAKIVAEGYESLGFSIPINEAKTIIDDLIKYGYAKGRVSLGIRGNTYTSTNSNYNGFQIRSIDKNSSLMNTAVEVGDIVTHVDGVRVTTYAELRSQLSTHGVGDTVTLTLLHVNTRTRQVETITVSCVLQEGKG